MKSVVRTFILIQLIKKSDRVEIYRLNDESSANYFQVETYLDTCMNVCTSVDQLNFSSFSTGFNWSLFVHVYFVVYVLFLIESLKVWP